MSSSDSSVASRISVPCLRRTILKISCAFSSLTKSVCGTLPTCNIRGRQWVHAQFLAAHPESLSEVVTMDFDIDLRSTVKFSLGRNSLSWSKKLAKA
jgi:hypothetical protein